MYRRAMFLAGMMVALLGVANLAAAAIISGEIDSVDGRTLVIKTSSGKAYKFEVPVDAEVTLDKKKAKLAEVKPGKLAVVYTNSSDQVTKVKVRTATRRPPPKPAPQPTPEPEPQPETPTAAAASWPQFRGPNRDNVSSETGLLKEWPAGGPKLAWSKNGLGEAYSTVAIADGKVVTMGNQGNEEAILCMDVQSGKPLWKASNGQAYTQGRGNGPRGTPTIDGDKVYALGGHGQLSCVDFKNGKLLWTKNILQEFGARNIRWGISESVLIDGDKLICTPGGRGATMVALDKNTGKEVWRCVAPDAGEAGYASCIIVDPGGVKQYVNFTGKGLIGVRASDGKLMWQNASSSNGTANCSTAIYSDGFVFSASNYGTGGALLKLTSSGENTAAEQVYHTRDMKNHHGGMILLDGYLYGSNDPGILTCLEFKTGKVVWQDRSVGKGSLAYADGHLYLRSEKGPIALVEATPEGYREKGRFDQPQRSDKPSWAHPVVADGKLFIRDMDVLLVYDVSQPGE